MSHSPPPARPPRTYAEGPASPPTPDVWLCDFGGTNSRRVDRADADALVVAGIADRVSGAGHVRLKLGISIEHACEVGYEWRFGRSEGRTVMKALRGLPGSANQPSIRGPRRVAGKSGPVRTILTGGSRR